MISFDTGIPDFHSLIVVEGYGPAQLRSFAEEGTVNIGVGYGRTMTIPGATRWRYAKR